jgi:serine/threonine protein kinase
MSYSTPDGSSRSGHESAPGELIPPGYRLGRYEVLGQVGAGGMGVVYRARDIERGTTVAIKTLHRMEPGALLRLKNEFRFIANVSHRNLLSLHELFSVDGQWFFTMEFIEGENLWGLLCHGETCEEGAHPCAETLTVPRNDPSDNPPPPNRSGLEPQARPGEPAPVEWTAQPRLPIKEIRRIFRELALGISALHSAKRLHCDIKPRNVMRARDGRVVLVDFGLASDQTEPSESELAGTPAYISPEQVLGQPASESSDWYAFGVMLYEALTGRRAFPRSRSLMDKASMDRPAFPPSPEVPEDLRTLCLDLLVRDPALRPSGREVLKRLGLVAPGELEAWPTGELLGREPQLAALREAYQDMTEGRTVVVHAHGPSGMGKTALVRRFFEFLDDQRQAVVLSGRCYERESLPYKAFDSLVDALADHLRTLPQKEVAALVPPDALELVRIFPVLRRVEAFSGLEPGGTGRDQHELRRRALRAFKLLLARLAERVPLVLHIDDLQWSDEDSGVALGELLEAPDAPRLLLVCSYRTGEGVAADLLAAHRRRNVAAGEPLDVREVVVGPLSDADARQLAGFLFGRGVDPRVEGIIREAQGSPFFVEELVRYSRLQGVQHLEQTELTLDEVVRARVGQLSEDARRLLEVVAVAGQPVARRIASRAAALQGDPYAPWTELRSAHLIRTRNSREEELVECYHDRIRESVHASVPAVPLRDHHLRLATQLEEWGQADPERLARHFRSGGKRDKAGRYTIQAAERAASALAFGRAAELYGEALEDLPGDCSLLEKRADALVNAGRCAEAAPLYLKVAGGSAPEVALGLRQRAAEQYLMAGVLPEGLGVLKPLLAELGLPFPQTSRKALWGLIGRSLWMQLGGMRFKERPVEEIPRRLAQRMEVAWIAAKGVGLADVMRGGYFSVRCMQMALEAGDAPRIARGLLGMGMTTVARGGAGEVERGERLLTQARQMCERLGDPYLLGFSRVVRGTSEMTRGRWRNAHALVTEGSRILEEHCTGVAWEYSQAHSCGVYSLTMLGDLAEAALQGNRWLRVAEQNGDRFGTVWLRINTSIPALATDGPEAAAERVREALRGWHSEGMTPQHLFALVSSARCELYRGEPAAAWKLLEDSWKRAEREHTMGWQFSRVMATLLRAGTAVAVARTRPAEREVLLRVARKDAQRLEREGPHHARGSAALVRAAVASAEGHQEEAVRSLEAAITGFTEAEMVLHAACARRRQGELLGGDEGRALVATSEETMRARGIREPARWAACFAPGFTEG